MWYQETVFYQICPLGLCGAPEKNDDIQAHRILKIKEFVPYLEELGIGAVYFNPVFKHYKLNRHSFCMNTIITMY